MHKEIIRFWFEELEPKMWWIKSTSLDKEIQRRFGLIHRRAVAAELVDWRETAKGSLAEVIVLDQFSRNIYRDRPESFAYDGMALVLAQQAIEKSFDQQISEQQRGFFYLPFMHSESKVVHDRAVELYEALGNQDNLAFELKHREIIERFGRYPHRNNILGRQSTPEELKFLETPGSSF